MLRTYIYARMQRLQLLALVVKLVPCASRRVDQIVDRIAAQNDNLDCVEHLVQISHFFPFGTAAFWSTRLFRWRVSALNMDWYHILHWNVTRTLNAIEIRSCSPVWTGTQWLR